MITTLINSLRDKYQFWHHSFSLWDIFFCARIYQLKNKYWLILIIWWCVSTNNHSLYHKKWIFYHFIKKSIISIVSCSANRSSLMFLKGWKSISNSSPSKIKICLHKVYMFNVLLVIMFHKIINNIKKQSNLTLVLVYIRNYLNKYLEY